MGWLKGACPKMVVFAKRSLKRMLIMKCRLHEENIIDRDVYIGVLTYNIRHRKTYDIICLLKALGYKNVFVYALPLQYKKSFTPMLQHRPEMPWPIDTDMLCNSFSYKYIEIKDYSDINRMNGEIMLVGGAALLPDVFIQKYRVINAHPGYIPNCRGLDAYKWAIYERQPIGVTSHLIGEEVDAGEVILREMVPVYPYDTFFSLAQRVYEMEIKILIESIQCIIQGNKTEYIGGGTYIVHKRMPKHIECNLLKAFEIYKTEVLRNGIS